MTEATTAKPPRKRITHRSSPDEIAREIERIEGVLEELEENSARLNWGRLSYAEKREIAQRIEIANARMVSITDDELPRELRYHMQGVRDRRAQLRDWLEKARRREEKNRTPEEVAASERASLEAERRRLTDEIPGLERARGLWALRTLTRGWPSDRDSLHQFERRISSTRLELERVEAALNYLKED